MNLIILKGFDKKKWFEKKSEPRDSKANLEVSCRAYIDLCLIDLAPYVRS